jgi:hypothetical protein
VPQTPLKNESGTSALLALTAATNEARSARRVAILARGGHIRAGGRNKGGNGKREENQRAAGHGLSPGILYLSGSRNGIVSEGGNI